MINERAKAILDFCFIETKRDQWFKKDENFDTKLNKLFKMTSKKRLTTNMMNGKIIRKNV